MRPAGSVLSRGSTQAAANAKSWDRSDGHGGCLGDQTKARRVEGVREWPVRPQLGRTLPARPVWSSQVWESQSLSHWGTCQGTLGRLLHLAGPLLSHL